MRTITYAFHKKATRRVIYEIIKLTLRDNISADAKLINLIPLMVMTNEDQLEEQQEEQTGEVTTNQVF